MVWQVYDAKARFSELLDSALKKGPQILTRRGVEAAVVVSIDEWNRLREKARSSIPDPLLDPNAPHDIPVGPRRPFQLRPFSLDEGEME